MKPEVLGVHPFDRADPINREVIADEIASTRMGISVRRVTYQDPETNITYISPTT